MAFNENTRVKIPAIVHLTRLGYKYLSLKDSEIKKQIDVSTNIFTDIFFESIKKINPEADNEELNKAFENIKHELGNDDLGRVFYERLINKRDNIRIVDFEDFSKNTFNVVTELPCKNGDDEFRPDITILINGIPLGFIEVKKPNNEEGIKAEYDRINNRFKIDKFRKFINITQLLIFSNNMEYDDPVLGSLAGAYYATPARNHDVFFNYMREQRESEIIDEVKEINNDHEEFILEDNNLEIIKTSPEYITNKRKDTPTNKIITSILSKPRLKTFLQFGIAYVEYEDKDTHEQVISKQIMRYPQFFATKSIEDKLDQGIKRGVIWHTQGSGKTALAYYDVNYLTDYYRKKGIIPKFYFIVDRLDLLTQATKEFSYRGLVANNINNKEALVRDFHSNSAISNPTGKPEITVVNIQKFKDETQVLNDSDYDIKVQRIYFLDEAHRSYNPKGSFLANLYNSDKEAVKIALTGTPLIILKSKDSEEKEDAKTTRNIFGDYIHKYYYNDSIRDGYTLKLIREEIETDYKIKLQSALEEITVKVGQLDRHELFSHEHFVEPMLEYIITDFKNSQVRFGEKNIGAMVVCDSSDQARKMKIIFDEKYKNNFKSALILHNEGDKETRKDQVDKFKKGKIDILFVYNMLLTGFDAPRLKKLYLGRVVKSHNLLQTLTRVNRPYENFKVGYVVDFADISKEFDATNKAYFDELNREYGNNLDGEKGQDVFGSLFMSEEEINKQMEEIKSGLFYFNTENAETFSNQINEISDRKEMIEIKKLLENARNIYNMIRLFGHFDLLEKLDFKKLNQLYNIASERLDLLNFAGAQKNGDLGHELLNTAIENVYFDFKKISEKELSLLANEEQDYARKARIALAGIEDTKDEYYLSLLEELTRLLSKYNIQDQTTLDPNEMSEGVKEFKKLYEKIKKLNDQNNLLKEKYRGDVKYMRTHKRVRDTGLFSKDDQLIYKILINAKDKIDDSVKNMNDVLNNKAYFTNLVGQKTINSFDSANYPINSKVLSVVRDNLSDEYIEQLK